MAERPPTPLVQAFVVCRAMFENPNDHEFVLVAPCSSVDVQSFPAQGRRSVYAQLADAEGRYEMEMRLVDQDGEEVWNWRCPGPVCAADRLLPHRIALYDLILGFPRPGRYDLLLVGNGEILAQHALWARQV